jgi:hypothetical protein
MMRAHTIRMSVLSVLLAVFAIPAVAQNGDDALRFTERTPGVTGHSMALSGAGMAGLPDASAFVTNPAGLGWMSRSSASGSLALLNSRSLGAYNAPGFQSSIEESIAHTGVGSLSYLFKVPTTRGSMVIGAALSRMTTFDRGLAFDGDNGSNSITDYFMPYTSEFTLVEDGGDLFPEFSRTLSFIAFETYAIDLDQGRLDAGEPVPFLPAVSAGTVAQTGWMEETGGMTELNFGGAVEVAPDVMVGISMNIPVGNYERIRVLEEDDYLNDNDGFGGTTDFNFLHFSERFTSELVGVNGRFGVSAKANENLYLGATIETPTYFAIDETYSTYLETEFDNGDFFSYGDGPGQDAGSGEFDYTLRTPWRLGMGGRFMVSDLSLLADVEWVDWSQMEFDASRYDFQSENMEIRNALDGVINVRLGATYDFGSTQVRAGAAFHPDPRAEQPSVSEGFPHVDRGRTFTSLGVGHHFGDRMSIDLAWMAERFDDRADLYTDVSGAPYVQEELVRHRFQIGLRFGL